MATLQTAIAHLTCGACTRTITCELSALLGVSDVAVDHASPQVSVMADETRRPDVVAQLASLGYPERGAVHGVASGVAAAKSFVNCAIGRVT